jgi:predicted metal-dependent enzyme (double-stranded beta helix superfamily)
MLWILILFLAGCSTTSVDLAKDCDVRLASLTPASGSPGETITAVVHPVTTVWDTAVYMGSNRAEVVDVDRTGCEECDQCKKENECNECEDCDACDVTCNTGCTETVSFTAVTAGSGNLEVSIYNGYGQSNTQSFDMVNIPLRDTSAIDTASEHDTSAIDSGELEPTDSGEAPSLDTGAE